MRKVWRLMSGSVSLWRSAIVPVPAGDLSQESLASDRLVWLPTPRRFAFRADPFGLWSGGQLHVFVEGYDYSDRRGRIEVLTYSEKLELVSETSALVEPWHLSYPFVFEADGERWMLPEAHQSGKLTLYRAASFPVGWRPELTIPVPAGAVDPTPLFFNGRWWLFYCVAQRQPHNANQLHVAFAERLQGPWHEHPLNPVRVDRTASRPAGTPLVAEGHVDLPVQDCRAGYGGAVRRLRIHLLDEERFEAADSAWLSPDPVFAPFTDGLHTLSAAGPVSLIDVRRIDRSIAARFEAAKFKVRRRLSG